MANSNHLTQIKQGVPHWNQWRQQQQDLRPDLSDANLSDANLSDANLSGANLNRANLGRANLSHANLALANLIKADLRDANLRDADFHDADLRSTDLRGTDPYGANFHNTNLREALLSDSNLRSNDLSKTNFNTILETLDREKFSDFYVNRYLPKYEHYRLRMLYHQQRQQRFQWGLTILSMVSAAVVSLEAFFDLTLLKICAALLAIIVSGLVTIQKSSGHLEKWIFYKKLSNDLENELDMYKAGADQYTGEDKDTLFVKNVRSILNKANQDMPAGTATKDNQDTSAYTRIRASKLARVPERQSVRLTGTKNSQDNIWNSKR